MEVNIYKEDMEIIEKALRHELELLRMVNHDNLLNYDIMNTRDLIKRWLFIKQVYGYKNITNLS